MLVILIENGGIDLGIPELVDKLLSSVPGASLMPDCARQQLVDFIRDKIKGLTDTLIETVELALNRYAALEAGALWRRGRAARRHGVATRI